MKLPDGWKETKIKDILSVPVQNGYSPVCQETETGRWVLSLGALPGYSFNESQIKAVPLNTKINNDFLPQYGDILISQSNTLDKVGRSAVFRDQIHNCSYPDLMMRFRINEKIITLDFLEKVLQSDIGRKYFESKAAGKSSSMVKINKAVIEDFNFIYPPISEQKAIVDTLSVWDSMIEKTEKLIDEKEKKYSWFMEKVFSVKGKKGQVLVKKFAQEVSVRNSSLSVTQVLSVTNKNGFVLPEEQFSKHVASKDLSNYKVVKKRQFAYNPSRINVGSIARLDNWDNAVLSPMYTVFEIKEDMVNSDYFFHWLHSHRANQKIKTCAQGGVRAIVNFSDFASISLYVPEKRKQDEIADVLNSVQKEITLFRQLVDKYKLQKQGLMQKLLTGQWRIK